MKYTQFLLFALLQSAFLFNGAAQAETVLVDVVMTDDCSMELPHDWFRELAKTRAPSVTIRRQKPGDVITIAQTGTDASPIWRVTGTMDSSGTIFMPDGSQFRYGDAAGLADWINALPGKMRAKQQAQNAPAQGDFGLSEPVMTQLLADLKQPLSEETAGLSPLEIVQACAKGLSAKLSLSSAQIKALKELDPVDEELSGLAKGTVLAYVLRPAGLCLIPQDQNGKLQYSIAFAAKGVKPWSIGIKVVQRESEVIPDIMETIPVNISNTPLRKVMQSISDRIKVPFLYDLNSMARYGIDLDVNKVNLTAKQIRYLLLMKKALSQSKLIYELRMDENGEPFFWITTFRSI